MARRKCREKCEHQVKGECLKPDLKSEAIRKVGEFIKKLESAQKKVGEFIKKVESAQKSAENSKLRFGPGVRHTEEEI